MTTALLIALAGLLVAALLGQIRINRNAELARRPRPKLPATDPRQALEYGLAWVFADGRVVNHPLYPDPIQLGTYAEIARSLPARTSRDEEADAAYTSIYGEGDRELKQAHDRWRHGGPVVLTGAQLHRMRYDRERGDRAREARDEWVATWCLPATAHDYAAWLHGWLRTGHRTTHDYDYDLPGDWYVLRAGVIPTSPPSCYGALAFQVIVPQGSEWPPAAVPRTFHRACGHSTFYFDGPLPAIVGDDVPTYRDVRAILAAR